MPPSRRRAGQEERPCPAPAHCGSVPPNPGPEPQLLLIEQGRTSPGRPNRPGTRTPMGNAMNALMVRLGADRPIIPHGQNGGHACIGLAGREQKALSPATEKRAFLLSQFLGNCIPKPLYSIRRPLPGSDDAGWTRNGTGTQVLLSIRKSCGGVESSRDAVFFRKTAPQRTCTPSAN